MVPADWAVWDYMAGRRAGRFNYEVEVFLKLMIRHDCSLNQRSVFDDGYYSEDGFDFILRQVIIIIKR